MFTRMSCLIGEGFDVSSTTAENVRYAFLVHLPFRFRIGRNYHHEAVVKRKKVDLYLRNVVDIGSETAVQELFSQHRDLFTHAFDRGLES